MNLYFLNIVQRVGEFQLFVFSVMKTFFRPPIRFRQILNHLYFIGVQSTQIILLTGFFTGAVLGLQIGGIFAIFRAESLMGSATALSLAKELAPLVTSFLLTGRVGSSITAEISTMKVTEQLDAMEAMGVDPFHYLIVPRVFASVLIMPLLSGLFMFMGVVGCYVSGMTFFDIDQGVFIDKIVQFVAPSSIFRGLEKMVLFSLIISIVSCYFGVNSSGGAKGVGNATTQSVVASLILILCSDLFLSYLQIHWF